MVSGSWLGGRFSGATLQGGSAGASLASGGSPVLTAGSLPDYIPVSPGPVFADSVNGAVPSGSAVGDHAGMNLSHPLCIKTEDTSQECLFRINLQFSSN